MFRTIMQDPPKCSNCKWYRDNFERWCKKHDPYPDERGMDLTNMSDCKEHAYKPSSDR